MRWEPLKAELGDDCITAFMKRYHFSEDQRKDVEKCYRQLVPLVHATAAYKLVDKDIIDFEGSSDKQNSEAVINQDKENNQENVKYAYTIITLGNGVDSFISGMSEAQDYQKSYMAECFSNEFLDMAYQSYDKYLMDNTGLFPGDYKFIGSQYSIENMEKLFRILGQKQVHYNDAYALRPRASVAFVVPLYEHKVDKHTYCTVCKAKGCSNRKAPYSGNYHTEEKTEEKKNGLIHLYTGDGKGKTTAAIGLAVRAAGAGEKVVFAQFMKGQKTSELPSLINLDNIRVIRNEKNLGWFKDADAEKKNEFRRMHNEALDEITNIILANNCDVLVLDEVTYPVNYEIINIEKLLSILDMKEGRPEIIMTGRNASEELRKRADYITEMKCIEHPYSKGVPARKGIEY